MRLQFWGTRGSIASPGPRTIRIGGNTTCVEITADGADRIIIDAGTGIRPLGQKLIKESNPGRMILLLTHSHWDHLSGFTFFAPAFNPAQEILIYGNHMAQEVLQRDIFERRDNRYTPVNVDDLRASFTFNDQMPGPFLNGDIEIKSINLNHPGNGFGYRFNYRNKSITFITDNEIGLKYEGGHDYSQLVKFCHQTDVLVHDAQYLPGEIEAHHGWGHSTYLEVLELAKEAQIPHVFLTHHDPERSDEDCTHLIEQARHYLTHKKLDIRCELAVEGDVFTIG